MEAGVVNPVAKAMTDLETLQAKRRVKDIRLWERTDMAALPEYHRLIAYGQALLKVKVPEPIGKVAEHGIRKLREDMLTVINGIIKYLEPFNPNIPTLMANDLPSALTEEGHERVAPDTPPTSGHEHIIQNPPSVENIRQLLASAQAGLDSIVQPSVPAPAPVRYDIGWAMDQLRAGAKVGRANWNGKGMWLRLMTGDVSAEMTIPYVYIEYPAGHRAYPEGSRVPWFASQTDLLAEDWMIIE